MDNFHVKMNFRLVLRLGFCFWMIGTTSASWCFLSSCPDCKCDATHCPDAKCYAPSSNELVNNLSPKLSNLQRDISNDIANALSGQEAEIKTKILSSVSTMSTSVTSLIEESYKEHEQLIAMKGTGDKTLQTVKNNSNALGRVEQDNVKEIGMIADMHKDVEGIKEELESKWSTAAVLGISVPPYVLLAVIGAYLLYTKCNHKRLKQHTHSQDFRPLPRSPSSDTDSDFESISSSEYNISPITEYENTTSPPQRKQTSGAITGSTNQPQDGRSWFSRSPTASLYNVYSSIRSAAGSLGPQSLRNMTAALKDSIRGRKGTQAKYTLLPSDDIESQRLLDSERGQGTSNDAFYSDNELEPEERVLQSQVNDGDDSSVTTIRPPENETSPGSTFGPQQTTAPRRCGEMSVPDLISFLSGPPEGQVPPKGRVADYETNPRKEHTEVKSPRVCMEPQREDVETTPCDAEQIYMVSKKYYDTTAAKEQTEVKSSQTMKQQHEEAETSPHSNTDVTQEQATLAQSAAQIDEDPFTTIGLLLESKDYDDNANKNAFCEADEKSRNNSPDPFADPGYEPIAPNITKAPDLCMAGSPDTFQTPSLSINEKAYEKGPLKVNQDPLTTVGLPLEFKDYDDNANNQTNEQSGINSPNLFADPGYEPIASNITNVPDIGMADASQTPPLTKNEPTNFTNPKYGNRKDINFATDKDEKSNTEYQTWPVEAKDYNNLSESDLPGKPPTQIPGGSVPENYENDSMYDYIPDNSSIHTYMELDDLSIADSIANCTVSQRKDQKDDHNLINEPGNYSEVSANFTNNPAYSEESWANFDLSSDGDFIIKNNGGSACATLPDKMQGAVGKTTDSELDQVDNTLKDLDLNRQGEEKNEPARSNTDGWSEANTALASLEVANPQNARLGLTSGNENVNAVKKAAFLEDGENVKDIPV